MPRRPTTRGPLGRRSLPPRPTFQTAAGPTAANPERRTTLSRPARLVEREAPYLLAELRRIALVTGTCIGLLALLVIVDRLS
jgi:hypothetical protein